MKKHGGTWLAKALVAAARFGAMNTLSSILLALSVLTWAWVIPTLRDRVESQKQNIAGARRALDAAGAAAPVSPKTLSAERLALFYDVLGEKAYAEQQLKTLFAVAARNNLILSQADYKAAHDKNGGFHTYQIALPVKGSYAAIRQFCEQVLIAIPFASLDELVFKRESVGNPAVDAKLHFTLYLSGDTLPHHVSTNVKELVHE